LQLIYEERSAGCIRLDREGKTIFAYEVFQVIVVIFLWPPNVNFSRSPDAARRGAGEVILT
jgi:hypothetical protein